MLRPALLALLLAAPLAVAAQTDASVVPDDAPAWVPMEEAIATAQADDKLILVYGYAAWCGYCVKFDNEVFTDDAVQAYVDEHFAATRLDLEDERTMQFFDAEVTGDQLGRAMGISGTPTNVFVGSDGTMITKLPGYTDAETFLYALQYVKEEAYTTTPFDAFLAARKAGLDLRQSVETMAAPRPPEPQDGTF